jgi:putative redox protein
MVEARIIYQGHLRCLATHGPSGITLLTDAPVDNMGKGESFSPSDLVGVALGSCMITTMGIVAQRHEINLNGSTVRVEKHMASAPTRRIAKLVVEIHVKSNATAEQRPMLERAALVCPVHKSLHPDIEIPVTITWE